ncbi:MAG: hypothetical protein HKN16_01625, partial [Saprospiraceae bacterium]|nr:hypothetical protein [Saprospiraceae bacterium]
MNRILFCTIFTLLLGFPLLSQTDSLSTYREHFFSKEELPLFLDSSLVFPKSILVVNVQSKVDLSNQFDYVDGLLIYQGTIDPMGLMKVSFRVLGVGLENPQQDLDPKVIQLADEEIPIGVDVLANQQSDNLINMGGLNYQGSFSRGVSFGNSQNLVLNSAFNLRFNGIIGDDVEVQAAISDQNIPLQPEGNTEQLQEFDKIYIQLKKDHSSLIAGDYELSRPTGHFVNYFKKLQGARFDRAAPLGKGTLRTGITAAISKGKFARNILDPFEGNQGPYRLQGNNGERFLIVLSGTERVYVDGNLMIRGLENDYTIDYN